jgi:hypothetical protein
MTIPFLKAHITLQIKRSEDEEELACIKSTIVNGNKKKKNVAISAVPQQIDNYLVTTIMVRTF